MKVQAEQKKASPELIEWLSARQSRLLVNKVTTTPGGQTLDWVPIGSQSEEKIATPPPSNLSEEIASDAKKPSKRVHFDFGEQGPAGHVPILRPDISQHKGTQGLDKIFSKRFNTNRTKKTPTDPNPAGYFHATSAQWSQIYGCDAWLNVWDPQIDIPSSPGDDHSISQLWIQNYQKPDLQSLEAGLTVDKGLNGDSYNHLFTFYATNGYPAAGQTITGVNGKPAIGNNIGGYNRAYAGWIQYHPTIFPGIRINGSSAANGAQLDLGIKYQLFEDNWWFGINNSPGETGAWTWIGYYPASLFSGGLGNYVQWVSFGGEVYSALSNPCSTTDQMGSGRRAAAGFAHAAYQKNLRNQSDTNGTMVNFDGTPETDTAAAKCPSNSYTIQPFMNSGSGWGSYQYYGGPSV